MDKNNDIQVNKVNKWDYGVVDMSLWHLKDEFDALVDKLNGVYGIDVFEIEELTGDTYSSIDKVLERFNELEAIHHKECGMISQYEEENRSLREHRKKLIDARDELAEDNNNLERDRDIYAEHLRRLCRTLSDNGIIADWNEAAIKWNLYKWDEVKNQWCSYDKATTLESCKKHYEDELRIRCEEIDGKNKLIEELNHEIHVFRLKNLFNSRYGLTGQIELLNKEIDDLKKKNNNLKDTIERNEDFGKYVGKRVAESIREGWEHNLYKLHPYTRIDIHVEQVKDLPFAFNHCAIPNVSVMFNNTQTEMERDTAEHECEELDKKIKELEKEKIDLKTTLAMCERDANVARNLCHNIAFNAERARNKTPWFNDTYEEEK